MSNLAEPTEPNGTEKVVPGGVPAGMSRFPTFCAAWDEAMENVAEPELAGPDGGEYWTDAVKVAVLAIL